jgi:hypothetical protein
MSRYYFNVRDGHTTFDDEGMELSSFAAARDLAITYSGELLRDGVAASLWAGEPWCMWVTDAPADEGNTLFTLEFSADAHWARSKGHPMCGYETEVRD